MMTIFLNEEKISLPRGSTLQGLLEQVEVPPQPYAVALNADFVPRGRYGETSLDEGDRVELVIATQGG